MLDWRLDIVTERDKRPTKRGAVASSTSRSSAKRRGEAKQKGAPARDKKTRELIEDPGFAERPHIARSLTGSDDQNFSRNLVHQAVAAQCPDYSASDQQVGATLTAMAAMQPADALEGMVGVQLIAIHHAAMECYRRAAIDGQSTPYSGPAVDRSQSLRCAAVPIYWLRRILAAGSAIHSSTSERKASTRNPGFLQCFP
jgi:hypothetical protein